MTYETAYATRTELQRQFLQGGSFEDPDPVIADNFTFDRSVFSTQLGAVFTAAYDLSPDHRLSFRSLIDRNVDDQTLVGRGVTEQTGLQQLNTEFTYEQNQLGYGQLGGEHHFSFMDIDWRSALAQTTQNVPDQRITNSVLQPDGNYTVSNDGNGASRIFQDLTENLTDTQIDFTIPFTTGLPFTDIWSLPAKFKFGPAYAFRKRDATIRVFQNSIQVQSCCPFDYSQPLNDVFNPRNIGGGQPPFPFNFREQTQPQDDFRASQEIAAGYVMTELPLIRDQLRLIAGVRTEYSYMQLDIINQANQPAKVIKNDLDPLPGVNLVYTPRPDMNVRAAYSRTVSRPEFRELSPAVYPAPRGLRGLVGNPALVETDRRQLRSPLGVVSVADRADLARRVLQEDPKADRAGRLPLGFGRAGHVPAERGRQALRLRVRVAEEPRVHDAGPAERQLPHQRHVRPVRGDGARRTRDADRGRGLPDA